MNPIRTLQAALPHDVRRATSRWRNPGRFRQWREMRYAVNRDGYSFEAFDRLRCIFIHLPKCAGVSVSRALFGNLGGGHRHIAKYQLIFNRREFHDYFKFTFVRNPWDRLVSAFFYMKQGGFSALDQQWADEHLSEYDDFGPFVRGWLTPENVRSVAMFTPQTDFICLGGSPAVDFIGNFETLGCDFEYVRKRLGVDSELPLHNTRKRSRVPYQRYYDENTRSIVADVYRRDLELLDYRFEDTSPHRVVVKNDAGNAA